MRDDFITFKRSFSCPDVVNDFFEEVYDSLEDYDIDSVSDALNAYQEAFDSALEYYNYHPKKALDFISECSLSTFLKAFGESDLASDACNDLTISKFFYCALESINNYVDIITFHDSHESVGESYRMRRHNKISDNRRMLESKRIRRRLKSDEKSILKKDYKQKGLLKLSDLELKVKEVKSKNSNYVSITLEWLSKDTNKSVCHVLVDKFPASDGYYWFGSLEVDKKYRGYGLGKQVVEFIKNRYKAGALAVAKDNEIAIRLYKSCGFKELERKDPNNKYYYLYYTPNRQKV